MNERTYRPANIAAAAVVIAGLLIVLAPQHAPSIVRLGLVTVAAAAGLYTLAQRAPPAWWLSPFEQLRTTPARVESDEIGWIRAKLSAPRQRLADGTPLPPETVRLLQPLIESALQREGIDPADRHAAGRMLSSQTRAVLTWHPPKRRLGLSLRSDPRATADIVHAVLNDLERLTGVDERPSTTDLRAT